MIDPSLDEASPRSLPLHVVPVGSPWLTAEVDVRVLAAVQSCSSAGTSSVTVPVWTSPRSLTVRLVPAGSPMPDMQWSRNGVALKKGSGMEQTPEFCRIQLKAAKRGDTGEYELKLKNSVGTELVPITIKVIGEWLEK